jgi:hypothetical protein
MITGARVVGQRCQTKKLEVCLRPAAGLARGRNVDGMSQPAVIARSHVGKMPHFFAHVKELWFESSPPSQSPVCFLPRTDRTAFCRWDKEFRGRRCSSIVVF